MAKRGPIGGKQPRSEPGGKKPFTWSPKLPPELTIGSPDDKAATEFDKAPSPADPNAKAPSKSAAALLKRYNALLGKAKNAVNDKTSAADRKTIAKARADLAKMRIRLDKLGFGTAKVKGKGANKSVTGVGIKKALKKAK